MKLFNFIFGAATAALWLAVFYKHGAMPEAILACIAFYTLNALIYLLGKLTQINLEFLRLSSAAYEAFKQQKG